VGVRLERRTRLPAVAAALLAPLALAVPATGTARAASGCPGANLVPTTSNLEQIRTATLCLVNAKRARRGLAPLAAHGKLERAAGRYARRMVAKRFFDHVSPGGSTMTSRIRRTGYLRGAVSWSLGENIAWGTGTLATPRATVRAWMHSPGHRANILHAKFRDAGIGVAAGAPQRLPDGLQGATYVNEFGRRV
jgi:uncharacterized protein YkwD